MHEGATLPVFPHTTFTTSSICITVFLGIDHFLSNLSLFILHNLMCIAFVFGRRKFIAEIIPIISELDGFIANRREQRFLA